MNKLKAAEFIARMAHNGQKDKAGVDYINHPKTVSSFVDTEEEKIVALLHDAIEDNPIVTESDLRNIFGDTVVNALLLLAHKKGENYFDYIDKIKENALATKVKLADLKHNIDIKRISNPTDKDYQRLKKYKKAKEILEGGTDMIKDENYEYQREAYDEINVYRFDKENNCEIYAGNDKWKKVDEIKAMGIDFRQFFNKNDIKNRMEMRDEYPLK